MSNVLVYAEHAHVHLPKATAVAVTAGKKLAAISGGQAILAVLGSGIGDVASAAEHTGTDRDDAKKASFEERGPLLNDADPGARSTCRSACCPCCDDHESSPARQPG